MYFQIDLQEGDSHRYSYFNASTGKELKRRVNGIMKLEVDGWNHYMHVIVREYSNDIHAVIKGGYEVKLPEVKIEYKTFRMVFDPEIS